MATDSEKLILAISADTAQMKRALDKMTADTRRTTDNMVRDFGKVDKSTKYMADNMNQQMTKSLGATKQAVQGLTFQMNDIATSLAGGASPLQVMMQQGSQVSQVFQDLKRQGGSMGGALVGAIGSMLNPISLVSFGLIALAGYAYDYFTSVEDGSDDANKELKKHADALDSIISKYGDLAPEAKRVLTAMQDATKSKEAIKELNTTLAAMRVDAVERLNAEIRKIDGVSNEAKRAVQAAFGDRAIFAKLAEAFQELVVMIERGEDPTAEMLRLMKQLNELHMQAPQAGFDGMSRALAGMLPIFAQIVTQQKAVLDLQNSITGAAERTKQMFENLAGPFGPLLTALRQVLPSLEDINNFRYTFPNVVTDAISEATTATPSAAKEFLKSKAASEKVRSRIDAYDDAFATALAKLFQILPPEAQIFSGPRTYAEQAAAYANHLAGGGLAAPPGRSHHEKRGALDPQAADIIGVDSAQLAAAVAQIKELETLKGDAYKIDKNHVQLAGTQRATEKKAAEESMRLADQQADQQQRAHDNLLEHLASLDEQATLQARINEINASGVLTADQKTVAIEIETQLQTALNQAKKDGITLTATEIAQLREKAAAVAMTKVAADNIRASEKAVAEQAKEAARLSQSISQAAQTAVGGLVNDLRNGVEAGEAFNNMLQRILDSVIQMSLQSLFSQNALGGIFGSLLGGIGGSPLSGPGIAGNQFAAGGTVGSAHHGDGRTFSPSTWNGAPRFAAGGMVGLRPGEVPIIAHKGEMIIPRSQVGKGGTVDNSTTNLHQQNSTTIDMGNGVVTANNEDAKAFGLKIQKLVQLEMVKESRPGGLLRQIPQR